MAHVVPEIIDDAEILVHFIFDRNFRKKRISAETFIPKDVFLPNKTGVSLQRNRYCGENFCKRLAMAIPPPRIYAGFIIFKKSTFELVKDRYQKNERPEFKASILATPLNAEFKPYPPGVKIFTDSPGNPAHADLSYENPAPLGEETAHTAIRSFSRKLAKACVLVIDKESEMTDYNGKSFSTLL